MEIRSNLSDRLKPILLFSALFFTAYLCVDHYLLAMVLPLLKALYLLFSVYIYGVCFTLMGKNDKGKTLAETVGIGIVFTSAYFFSLSLLKLVNPVFVYLYFGLPLPILLFISRRVRFEAVKSQLCSFFSRDTVEYLIFLIPFAYALLPSTFYDSLVYHLGLPNFFLQNGGFVYAPEFMFANMFCYYEVFLIPSVFLGDFVPRLVHFFLGMVFLLSVTDFASSFLNVKKRRIFLITVVTLPLSMFIMTAVKADYISAFFIFLGIFSFLKKRLLLSSIFWGFALGVKVFSVIAFIVFLMMTVFKEKRVLFKSLFKIGLGAFVMLLPLLIKNIIFIKNPVFPFFSQYFSYEYWDQARYQLVRSEVGSHFKSIIDLLRAPFDFSYKLQGAGGMVGPVYLIFLPFLILYKKIKGIYILHFALILLLFAQFFGEAFRYIYIVFVLLSLFVALVYQSVNHKLLKAVFVVLVFFNAIFSLFTLESIYSARLIYFEGKSADEYRVNFFPTYKAYTSLHKISSPGDRILVAGEARGYHLKRPYMISSAHDYSILNKYIKRSHSPESFLALIKKDGFKYLVFNLTEFKRLQHYKRMNTKNLAKLLRYFREIKPHSFEFPLYIYKL